MSSLLVSHYHNVMLHLSETDGAVLLPVKVVPGASRTRLLGEWQGRARIAVAAQPEKGRANEAVLDFLADLLDLHPRRLSVAAGQSSPLKTIRIEGLAADAVASALQIPRS